MTKKQVAKMLLDTFDEFTYGEMSDLDWENLENLVKDSLELPSQQAKQTGVGEQHGDGRVSAAQT